MALRWALKTWRRIRKTILACSLLLAPVVLYMSYDLASIARTRPPGPHCSLAELAAKLSPPLHLAVVSRPGYARLVWLGPIPPGTIRSGPPCYVFDEHGRLLDWHPETGEGWPLDSLALEAYKGKPMTLDEASLWCEATR